MLFVLTLHAVGSTTVPIVVVELCTSARRTTPWLRRPGLIVAVALFVVGLAANAAFQLAIDPFVAAPAQLVGAVVLAGLAVVFALRLPRRSGLPGAVPSVWAVGLGVLVGGALIEAAPSGWAGAAVIAAVEVGPALLGVRWPRSARSC